MKIPMVTRSKRVEGSAAVTALISDWCDYLYYMAQMGREVTHAEVDAFNLMYAETKRRAGIYGESSYDRAKRELIPLFGPGEGDPHEE